MALWICAWHISTAQLRDKSFSNLCAFFGLGTRSNKCHYTSLFIIFVITIVTGQDLVDSLLMFLILLRYVNFHVSHFSSPSMTSPLTSTAIHYDCITRVMWWSQCSVHYKTHHTSSSSSSSSASAAAAAAAQQLFVSNLHGVHKTSVYFKQVPLRCSSLLKLELCYGGLQHVKHHELSTVFHSSTLTFRFIVMRVGPSARNYRFIFIIIIFYKFHPR